MPCDPRISADDGQAGLSTPESIGGEARLARAGRPHDSERGGVRKDEGDAVDDAHVASP